MLAITAKDKEITNPALNAFSLGGAAIRKSPDYPARRADSAVACDTKQRQLKL